MNNDMKKLESLANGIVASLENEHPRMAIGATLTACAAIAQALGLNKSVAAMLRATADKVEAGTAVRFEAKP